MRAFDPVGMPAAKAVLDGVTFGADAYDAAAGADAAVVVTEWDAFKALDFARLKAAMARPVIVDLRNIVTAAEAEQAGFAYTGVGRGGQGAGSRHR